LGALEHLQPSSRLRTRGRSPTACHYPSLWSGHGSPEATMSAQPPASIDLVLHETEIERGAQLREFDAIDGKAGIILGFAGALAALAPLDRNVLVDIGRVLAVAGALLALAAFWPRGYSVLELRP